MTRDISGSRRQVQYLAHSYTDGRIHRYLEDDLADPRNTHVVPECERGKPEAPQHLRDYVSNSYPAGQSWCPACAALPGSVWRYE